jgi:hypothetical protein
VFVKMLNTSLCIAVCYSAAHVTTVCVLLSSQASPHLTCARLASPHLICADINYVITDPDFCLAGTKLNNLMKQRGGEQLMPLEKADEITF